MIGFVGEAPLLSPLNTNKGLFYYWEDQQGGKLLSANEELSFAQDQINVDNLEAANYERSKEEANSIYQKLLKDLDGNDLAAKERAIKELPAAKNKVAQFDKPKRASRSALSAIHAKIEFLKSKLHIKKDQSINGFISSFTVN